MTLLIGHLHVGGSHGQLAHQIRDQHALLRTWMFGIASGYLWKASTRAGSVIR